MFSEYYYRNGTSKLNKYGVFTLQTLAEDLRFLAFRIIISQLRFNKVTHGDGVFRTCLFCVL